MVITNGATEIVRLMACEAVCAVGDVESIACTVKLLVAAVVGVPEITPVPGFKDSPLGSEPAVMLHAIGVAPPLDCSVALYGVLTVPPDSVVVVIVRTEFTRMLSCLMAVCAVGVVESVALTVNVVVPAAFGVPVIAPVLAFRSNPAGKVPAEMLQVTGGFPPPLCSMAPL